jgi:hypothetical protein
MSRGGRRKIQKIEHPPKSTNVNLPNSNEQRSSVITSKRGAKGKTFSWSNVKFTNVKPIWKGETVFIVGGGPSLKGFDFEQLRDKNTIIINKAVQTCPWADVLYWTDSRVYDWYRDDINNFKGHKYTVKPYNVPSDVKALKNTGVSGLEEEPNGVRHGNNSGYAAINLAYHLGVSRIVLLGYDMGNLGAQSHYHEGYPVKMTQDRTYETKMLHLFDKIATPLKEKGIQIINANPKSRINCFPKLVLEKALRLG